MRRRQPFSRAERMSHQVHRELATLLLRGQVRDPDVVDITITKVRLSKDLRIADVYIQSTRSAARGAKAVEGLTRARGYLRRQLMPCLNSRIIPEFRFHLDDTLDVMERLGVVLDRISTATDDDDDMCGPDSTNRQDPGSGGEVSD